jgi:hypothetical protein
MGSAGLTPIGEEGKVMSRSVMRRLTRCNPERLAELERLMAEGGVEAVIQALRKSDEGAALQRP